jgi:NAD(P)-dependent dehydrogenase (short-subunit alcohol dehydrogenase family)
MPGSMRLEGRTAVITGAASGIGRAIALALSQRGCHLALTDVNAVGLAETAGMIKASGLRITVHDLDVADQQAVAAFPEEIKAAHPKVDVLINNAGVALGGAFWEISEVDFEWLFDINFWGVVRMTRAFLPLLRASDDARIVNLSSLFGLIAPPGQTAYSASKFAVRGFSEALRRELKGSCIGVTVVHPGGVATAIARNARISEAVDPEKRVRAKKAAEALLKLPPEVAGETIVQGIERRRARILVGSDAKIVSIIERLFPVTYWDLLERRLRA